MSEEMAKAIAFLNIAIEKDFKIQNTLDTKEIFCDFNNIEIRECIDELLSGLKLKAFEYNGYIYVFASSEESPFAIKESDVKDKLNFKNNIRVYLSRIIFLVFLSEMYGGENGKKSLRGSISVEDLQNSVTEYLSNSNITIEDERENSINYNECAKEWRALPAEALNGSITSSQNSRPQFIRKTMQFYCNFADLVDYEADLDIYKPSKKLEAFISHGEFNMDRFEELKNIAAIGRID